MAPSYSEGQVGGLSTGFDQDVSVKQLLSSQRLYLKREEESETGPSN